MIKSLLTAGRWTCVLCLLILTACAGTARGLKTSVYQADEDLSLVDTSVSQTDANVVIRYPAIIDANAETQYFDAFARNAIGGSVGPAGQESDQVAQSVIAKSNYYAMSLYKELTRALPAHSVLLSPHIIYSDKQGRLSSKPLLASEKIASVLTIDFNAYSFPDTEKMMDAPPLTFGDLITPMFVIHSNRWLMPSTNGLLLSSAPLVNSAWNQSLVQAEDQFESRFALTPVVHQRPLDFISYLQEGPKNGLDIPVKNAGEARRDVISVEKYPLEKIRMDAELVANLATDHEIDPFVEDFVKGAVTRVVNALNQVDHDRATFFTRQTALSEFDPNLAQAFLMRSQDESVKARLQLAESLLKAEKKFLATQSDSIYAGTYEGTYGDKMRQMIAAEYRLLEERRDIARSQNISTVLAVIAAVGSVYAASESGSSRSYSSASNWRSMSRLLMMSSIWQVNSAMNKSAESDTVGENFLMQMAPALNQQISVQVEMLESNEEITAHDFTELRQKTMALYQSYARSMATETSPVCSFLHPNASQSGSWYGNCADGLATGAGYGLARDDEGRAIEYLGWAEQGFSQGEGAMIVRSPYEVGAIYYEGQFKGGVPDGLVRIEQPGRKAQTRKFRNGQDIGKGEEENLARLQF